MQKHDSERISLMPTTVSKPRVGDILWYAVAAALVGLAVALTYALAQRVETQWIFVS